MKRYGHRLWIPSEGKVQTTDGTAEISTRSQSIK